MIVIHHARAQRSFRVVWLAEEMGLPYETRPVELGGAKDEAFLRVSPTGMAPLLEDGEVRMVESIAMLEYLAARYGPTDLAVAPDDPRFAAYLQFLHFGESSLAALLTPIVLSRFTAPEAEKDNFGARACRAMFFRRLSHLQAALQDGRDYLLGADFTAADISVGYALRLARLLKLGDVEPLVAAYYARLKARPAFQRADAV